MDTETVVLCHILVEHGAPETFDGCRHYYTAHNGTGLWDQIVELCQLPKEMLTNDGVESETFCVLLKNKEKEKQC
jgi:hypothetical protein